MKILMVVHQFLPRHLAGSEVYTYRLAQALQARGHQLQLFFTEIRPDQRQYQLSRGEFDGIPYFEAVHNRFFATFRHTYSDPDMERLFATVLDTAAPDLIHIQHLYLHSIGYISMARARRIPTLYTLHEYMLMCLNGGLLLRPGLISCSGPEPVPCARCALATYPGVEAGETPARLPPPLRRLATKLGRFLRLASSAPDVQPHVQAVRERQRAIKAGLDQVDMFVAPSRYLRDQFVGSGLVTPARIAHSDYGFFVEPFAGLRKSASLQLRVGYVGTISDFKGVHVIVDAFREIRDPRIECRIYGDLDTFPEYKERLLRDALPPAVRLMGRVANDQIAATLADLDLLIVPSLWPENSPLTIHEAFLSGTPVITSDAGGMAELVQHDKSGLLFRSGDAADLRRQLLRALNEPGLIAALSRGVPHVKTIGEDAAEMEERYRQLRQGTRPVS